MLIDNRSPLNRGGFSCLATPPSGPHGGGVRSGTSPRNQRIQPPEEPGHGDEASLLPFSNWECSRRTQADSDTHSNDRLWVCV